LSPDIVVIGGANIDYNVVAERLPVAGETVRGNRFFRTYGGKGANQAVAAARMGARTAMIGRIGDDPDGQSIVDNMGSEGVNTRAFRVDTEEQTGSAHIIILPDGNNEIVWIPGANMRVSACDVSDSADLIASARVLMAQLETPLETVAVAAAAARRAGAIFILDPAPAFPLPAELYQMVDYIVPNEIEAGIITGIPVVDIQSAERALHWLKAQGVRFPVVKLGPRGAIGLEGQRVLYVPAFRVDVVDTTAAGDAFAGAMASALVNGATFEEALTTGCAAGALACSKYGAMPSLRHGKAVRALLHR